MLKHCSMMFEENSFRQDSIDSTVAGSLSMVLLLAVVAMLGETRVVLEGRTGAEAVVASSGGDLKSVCTIWFEGLV